jgi:hypothetical protein
MGIKLILIIVLMFANLCQIFNLNNVLLISGWETKPARLDIGNNWQLLAE